jgi:hypothetical protein
MQEKAHCPNATSFYEYHNSIIPAREVIDCAVVQFITSAMVMAKSCFLHRSGLSFAHIFAFVPALAFILYY